MKEISRSTANLILPTAVAIAAGTAVAHAQIRVPACAAIYAADPTKVSVPAGPPPDRSAVLVGQSFPTSDAETEAQFAKFTAWLEQIRTCELSFVGAEPIELHAARGDTVYRALITPSEHSVKILVEFVRSIRGAARLNVRLIEASRSAFAVGLTEDQWSLIRAYVIAQPAESAKLKAEHEATEARPDKSILESICVDAFSAAAEVELSESGKTTRIDTDACQEWDYRLVDYLLDTAIEYAGSCADPAAPYEERFGSCLQPTLPVSNR